jgi:hypothetical protein
MHARPGAGWSGAHALHAPRVLAMVALFALLAALMAATPSAARLGGGTTPSAVAGVDAATLFDRVHIIGASASAGFGVRAPVPADHPGRATAMPLARIAKAARAEGGTVSGDATSLFFSSPLATGRAQVDAVVEMRAKPTLVLGVDYLFWFTYGALNADRARITDESQRLALLEIGLANLDRIVALGVPVAVGDLPNMSAAVGRMLSKAQMPRQETLDAANARIRAWAAERPLVTIVPLAALLKKLETGEPFRAGSRTWSAKADGPLIQADQLHATFAGTVALLACSEQAVAEHFRRSDAPVPAGTAFEHDPAKVGARVRAELDADAARRAGAKGGDATGEPPATKRSGADTERSRPRTETPSGEPPVAR